MDAAEDAATRISHTKEALASARRVAGNPTVAITHIRPARAIISDNGNRWYLRGKGGAIYATFGIYGTVPLRSARVISAVTWPPLSVVPAFRTRIVPSESSTPMPMINIAFIIRLDPERIIVAPMRSPGRGNFVVESSGNLVALRRRLRAEGTAENSGSPNRTFPLPVGRG